MKVELFKEVLQSTQPYATTQHEKIQVELRDGWSSNTTYRDPGDVVDAYVTTKTKRFQLTNGALQSLASTLQMGRDMLFTTPAELVEPILNWWFSILPDEDSPAFTLGKNDVITAVIRPNGEMPEFPSYYIDTIVHMLQHKQDGADVQVHPWYISSERETFCIMYSAVGGHIVEDDVWYTGIVFKMSAAGSILPTVSLAFVRSSDFAVVIPPGLDQKYVARRHGKGRENTTTWLEDCVALLWDLADREADVFKWLVNYDGSAHAGTIIADVMREVSLPRVVMSRVLDSAVESDDDSGYGLLNNIVAALDYTPDSEYDLKINERIMRGAGRLWQVLDSRCESCHQMYH